jgi:hypothetical protein
MWPWSKLKEQRKTIAELESKLAACGLAARGCYAGFSHVQHSQSLVSVIALQSKLEALEKIHAVKTDAPLPP